MAKNLIALVKVEENFGVQELENKKKKKKNYIYTYTNTHSYVYIISWFVVRGVHAQQQSSVKYLNEG